MIETMRIQTQQIFFFKIMNKSMKPSAAAQRTLTEEEKEERIARIFLQKKASLAEGILFNLVQGAITNNDVSNIQCKSLVNLASEMADEFMKVVFGQEITIKSAE